MESSYKNVRYRSLFSLQTGGIYWYFKERVLKKNLWNVFIAAVLLNLILLIIINYLTTDILLSIESDQLASIDNINSQMQDHLESSIISIYSRLNNTMTIYGGDITALSNLDWNSDCSLRVYSSLLTSYASTCVIALTAANLAAVRTASTPALFFYKYGVTSYSGLTTSDQNMIQTIVNFLDLHRATFKSTTSIGDTTQFFFYMESLGLIVADSQNVFSTTALDSFTEALNTAQICDRYANCLADLSTSECLAYQTACTEYTTCTGTTASGPVDLSCLGDVRVTTNAYSIWKTRLQANDNLVHVCLQIITGLEFCARTDMQATVASVIQFNLTRFVFALTDSSSYVLYNNYETGHDFFVQEKLLAKLLRMGKAQAQSNYSPSTLSSTLSNIMKLSSDPLLDNQGIVHVDSKPTYDTMKILVSMHVVDMPLTYTESVSVDTLRYSILMFLISSDDKYAKQVEFYDLFKYLFFAYGFIEIIILVAFFTTLSYFLKSHLIVLAKSINVIITQHFGCFSHMPPDKFFRRFVKQIDQNAKQNSAEIDSFEQFSKSEQMATEIQILAENLNHFVWVVDFFSKAKQVNQDHDMLHQGIQIFKKINSYEGLEIVYDKIIYQYKRDTADRDKLEDAMLHCQEILQIQLKHRVDMMEKKERTSVVEEDLLKINNKICQYLTNVLNIIAKLLSLKLEVAKQEEYKLIYDDVIKIAKGLNLKDFQKVRLLLKKARILYKRAASGNHALFKRSAKKLDRAWKLLEEIKQTDKDDNFQAKNITVLKQKVLFHKGVASLNYGNDHEALKFLTSSLEYGVYFSNRLRVKTLNFMATIIKNPNFRRKREILQDLSAFIRKDKRNFYFLIDCSRQMVDQKNKIATIITKIFNEYMGEKDKMTIIKFGDRIEPILELIDKETIKKHNDLITVDVIEKQLQQYSTSGRCLYRVFQECIEMAKSKEEKHVSKYIIMFAFGENNSRPQQLNGGMGGHDMKHTTTIANIIQNNSNSQNSGFEDDNYSQANFADDNSQVSMSMMSMKDKMNRLEADDDFDTIQKELTDGFFHLLLIKSNIKNQGSQKSKILQLCEKSRRHYVIDLENKPYTVDIIKDVAGFLQ